MSIFFCSNDCFMRELKFTKYAFDVTSKIKLALPAVGFISFLWKSSGAPNDGFLPNALKRCFRLSGVLLKLCRLILGCAIKFVSVRFM